MYIKIEDNGSGMPEKLVEQLNQQMMLQEAEGRHIGINNVIQRLHLIYGEKARVRFTTGICPSGGTRVEIWLPDNDGKEMKDSETACG